LSAEVEQTGHQHGILPLLPGAIVVGAAAIFGKPLALVEVDGGAVAGPDLQEPGLGLAGLAAGEVLPEQRPPQPLP
jgi:hypothetical protein